MQSHSRPKYWQDVSSENWQDWRWQVRNRITRTDELKKVLNLDEETEAEINTALESLRMAITPYYASLIEAENPQCPVRKQAVPAAEEYNVGEADMKDPLHEDVDSPVEGITHRYPDRVLFLVTDQCSMYCRHCTRRRFAGVTDRPLPEKQIDEAIKYIADTPKIRDVLLSGGDPLLLSTQKLENIISRLYAIDHVEIIRIGSRAPVVLPQRITTKLTDMLAHYHPIYLNTHFNHPREITEASARACRKLAAAGIPLGNQSVLLKGINDQVKIMRELVHKLLEIRVKPYYLYQCDLSRGIEHFRTRVDRGISLIESLRQHTTGMAVPTYVIDAPGGGGKIPVHPDYVISRSPGKIVLRNFEGKIFAYTEPGYSASDNELPADLGGVGKLSQDDYYTIQEKNNLD